VTTLPLPDAHGLELGGNAVIKSAEGAGHMALARLIVRAPDPGEVRLDVAAAGVCGTDVHIADGEWPCRPPVALGHEVTGTVRDVGAGVSPEWIGARVACETFFSTDERCDLCRDGHPNLCRERRSIGSGADGGFATQLVIPERNLRRIPDWLSFEAAVLMEPLACVCNCLLDPAEINVGDRVLVTGPGPIGLLAAQLARSAGASVLVVGEKADSVRMRAAGELGFDVAEESDETAIAAFAGESGCDVAVECAGSGGATTLALDTLRPRGRLVQVGLIGHPVRVPIDLIVIKEIFVRGGLAAPPRAWRRAQAIVAAHRVELAPLATHTMSVSRWQDGFALARSGGAVKVVLIPEATAAPVSDPGAHT